MESVFETIVEEKEEESTLTSRLFSLSKDCNILCNDRGGSDLVYALDDFVELAMMTKVDMFCMLVSELGNTIQSLFGGGNSEPSPNVTEPVQVSSNMF